MTVTPSARLRVFDGIADQVADDLIQPLRVAAHTDRGARMFIDQLLLPLLRRQRQFGDHRLRNLGQIALAEAQSHPAFNALQIEQVFDQRFNAVHAQQAQIQRLFLQRR